MLKITLRKYLQNHLHHNAVLAEEITVTWTCRPNSEAAKTYHMKKKKPVVIAGYFSRSPGAFVSLFVTITISEEELSKAHRHYHSSLQILSLRAPLISDQCGCLWDR